MRVHRARAPRLDPDDARGEAEATSDHRSAGQQPPASRRHQQQVGRIVAIEETVAAYIPRPVLRNLLQEHPGAAEKMFESFSNRLARAAALLAQNSFMRADDRIYCRLVELNETRGRQDGQHWIHHGLTQNELACFAGLSREIVNRRLSAWREAGWIELQARKLRIINEKALTASVSPEAQRVGFGVGDGSTTSSSVPVAVPGVWNAVQVSAGFHHTCAARDDGHVVCWGDNKKGELGNGSTTSSLTAVMVAGVSTAVQVAAGYDFSCALLEDGTARCWGANSLGQVGNDAPANSSVPVTVPATVVGLAGAVQISAGNAHACAVIDDGTVDCWGSNGGAQLGDGTFVDSPVPVEVLDLTTAVEVAAGSAHSCALLDDGTLKQTIDNSLAAMEHDMTPRQRAASEDPERAARLDAPSQPPAPTHLSDAEIQQQVLNEFLFMHKEGLAYQEMPVESRLPVKVRDEIFGMKHPFDIIQVAMKHGQSGITQVSDLIQQLTE